MKKLAINTFIVLLLALIIQWLFIRYVPDIVYRIAVRRSGRTNEWINNGRTDARMRRVVMPNPDFVYSALFYDVSDHDLDLSGVLPDSGYASVAFYDDRCQPYQVFNNLGADHHGKFHFLLSPKSSSGQDQIQAKTQKGVLICRYLLKGEGAYQRMRAYQSQLTCAEK